MCKSILIRLCITALLLGAGLFANAQLGRGCYVGGVLYTTNTSNGNRFFYRSPSLESPCGYVRTGNDGNCRLYNSGPLNNNSSYTLYTDAFSNDWDEISCPIDDYVWVLVVSVAGITIARFRPIYKSEVLI